MKMSNLNAHFARLEEKIGAVPRLPDVSSNLVTEANIAQQKLDRARLAFLQTVADIEDAFDVTAWQAIASRWTADEIAKATPSPDNLDHRADCLFRALRLARNGKRGTGSGGEQRAHKLATVIIQHGHGLDSDVRDGLATFAELASANWTYAAQLYEKHIGPIPKG